jgi:hypothetical protein
MAPRDPRLRPFRVVLWVVYLTVVAIAVAITVRSVVRNLSGPNRRTAEGMLPTRAAVRVCVTELEGLNREQNERAWRLGAEIGEAGAVSRWHTWSQEWEQRVRDLADRCRIDADEPDPRDYAGHKELGRARDAVLALHRAYAVQVNRFAQDQANLARAAADALHEARSALARPPAR